MIDLGTAYRASRLRLTSLVAALPTDGGGRDPRSIQVACCPAWTVHGVISHLAAVAEDAVEGRLTGPPDEEATAAQVDRWAGSPTAAVLRAWAERGPALEKLLSEVPVWPALMDALSHEHDVRHAVGQPGARDLPEINVCARRLIKGLSTSSEVTVDLDGEVIPTVRTVRTSSAGETEAAAPAPAPITLKTTAFEAFRFRLGRRSRAQLAAMDWDGDPGPILDQLTIFGPNPTDILE